MKKIIIVSTILLAFFAIFIIKWFQSSDINKLPKIVVGTSNPGNIQIYSIGDNNQIKLLKTIETGYRHVYTVRVGDILNNGEKYIVAGMADGLTLYDPHCFVKAYKLDNKLYLTKEIAIADIDDIRCKDLTIGDPYNIGKNSIIVGTHGRDIVRIYTFKNNKWVEDTIEENLVTDYDKENNTSHQAGDQRLMCDKCVVHGAVHIIKVGDVDGDGKNEVMATISVPLEYQGEDKIGFLRVYKYDKGVWKKETIDADHNEIHRSLLVDDIDNSGKKVILSGVEVPPEFPLSVKVYRYLNGKWEKDTIWSEHNNLSVKGLDLEDCFQDGIKRILLGTGIPDSEVHLVTKNGIQFKDEIIGKMTDLNLYTNVQYNTMEIRGVKSEKSRVQNIVSAGVVMMPQKRIGWEDADTGYLALYSYSKEKNKWMAFSLITPAILGMESY